jgi:hypothetical protein
VAIKSPFSSNRARSFSVSEKGEVVADFVALLDGKSGLNQFFLLPLTQSGLRVGLELRE